MKRIRIFLSIVSIWFFIHTTYITIDGIGSTSKNADIAVIFGNTVHPNGEMSTRLKARVDKGLELYKDSLVYKLFVSGGLGKEGFYEAEVMAKYLKEQGVPQKDIIIDNEGNNTWLTASNLKVNYAAKSVIVVTQFYHISRSKLAMRKQGIDKVFGASPRYFELRDFYGLLREFFAFYKYQIIY